MESGEQAIEKTIGKKKLKKRTITVLESLRLRTRTFFLGIKQDDHTIMYDCAR